MSWGVGCRVWDQEVAGTGVYEVRKLRCGVGNLWHHPEGYEGEKGIVKSWGRELQMWEPWGHYGRGL